MKERKEGRGGREAESHGKVKWKEEDVIAKSLSGKKKRGKEGRGERFSMKEKQKKKGSEAKREERGSRGGEEG